MSQRRIKILHVVYFLEPGGMENGIVNITRGLDPKEFEVHCCCLQHAGAFVERLPHRDNVHVLGRESGFSVDAVIGLAKLIYRLKPDVVHSHNLGPLIYSALSSGFGLSVSVIQGEHSLLTAEECSPRRLRQRRIFYRACREIHTVSTQLRDQLVTLKFPERKLSVIVNGVDTQRFVPAELSVARAKAGLEKLDRDAFVFGIVGRFGPFKRHAALIDAFNIVASERANVHLLIVGDGGPEKDRVRQQVANSPVSDRIHLTGFQADVLPFYQSMNLLVVPSENEGMSNAVLEAMSCGVPVLAHQMCGNSEIIKHDVDGWILNLGSVERLAAELQNVLAVPSKLLKIKQMARAKVVQSFSIQTMVEQYAALYRRHTRNDS